MIKNVINLFRLQNTIDDTVIKEIKIFWTKKGTEVIKERVVRDIRNLFEQEDDYYKSIRVTKF